jgi:hypothetical protein
MGELTSARSSCGRLRYLSMPVLGKGERGATLLVLHADLATAGPVAPADTPGIEFGLLPISGVVMMRVTTRGASRSVMNAGWHVGTGRLMKSGKRQGPRHLTERRPGPAPCAL